MENVKQLQHQLFQGSSTKHWSKHSISHSLQRATMSCVGKALMAIEQSFSQKLANVPANNEKLKNFARRKLKFVSLTSKLS